MKITKNGKIKLDSGDVQVGNFVFHPEKHYVKVCDINENCSIRLHDTFTTSGRQLKAALELKKDNFLQVWATVMFFANTTLLDDDFARDVADAAEACIKRHKDIFGIKDDITAEEDVEALDEVKKDSELKENIEKEVYGEAK